MIRTRTLEMRPGVLRGETARSVLGNVGARVVALLSVAAVTVLVARVGGADDVGLLALMRVLPGLVGVVATCGLPGAMGYFVAGADSRHPGLWPTVISLMLLGAALGTGAWLLLTPIVHDRLMPTTTTLVVLATGATVATQLPVAVGKSCLQALGDPRGSNIVTAAEEAVFVPAFVALWALGSRGGALLVTSLLLADLVVAAYAWARIGRRVRERGGRLVGRPDLALARRVAAFGARSQVGGILNLLNLRLDVVVLGVLTGPAQVGVYVVASKYAELLRLPGLALTWVTYPKFAGRQGGAWHHEWLRVGRLVALGAVAAVLVASSAAVVLPFAYGELFRDAVWPAVWISLGLVLEPAAGVGSGYLLGAGRPGLSSVILGGGFLVTLALDLILIPRHGSLGAAWASAVAYLVTDILLISAWRRISARST
ncbi:lipopolysaccharide biosynthesis protein [Terrabacter sp. 2RAF25]|uniref:lipopolysaccharide biosynthesis protein n=1 Tax=Terrabacter sp. 2RAF25 TaxID=3232998 RepID=UPI003F9CC06E